MDNLHQWVDFRFLINKQTISQVEHNTHRNVGLIQNLSMLTKDAIRKVLVEQHGQIVHMYVMMFRKGMVEFQCCIAIYTI
jgi:hypothetical protein